MQQSYACDCETRLVCKDTVVKAKVLANEAKTLKATVKLNLHIVMELFNEERQQEILE